MVKNLPASAGHREVELDPRVRKIPWGRKWQSTPVFLPGKFHGQRSLEGSSSRGRKGSDMTETDSTGWLSESSFQSLKDGNGSGQSLGA